MNSSNNSGAIGASGDHEPQNISQESIDADQLLSFLSSGTAKYNAAYWAALRNGPFACIVFDLNSLDIVCASRLAAGAFGFSTEELEESDLSIIWPADDFEERTRFIEESKHVDVGHSGGLRPFRNKDGDFLQREFRFLDLDHPSRRLRIVFFPGLEGDGGWLLKK